MATTPNASPSTANVTGTGTKATTSTIKITATSAATLAAAKSAITQATGKAPANTFAVGSSTSVSQSTPGGKFVQGSTTTPALNKSVSSSSPPTNNGISSVLSSQSLLGIAALATAGLSVFNKVSSGINLSQSIVNNSNTATPASSTNNVQDPAQRAQAAVAVPSTGSTNNVSDPAQRAQAAEQAAATVTTPNTNSTNNVTDPAQRAQVADQVAIDNAQNVSTLQDPAQRQQAAITNADNAAPAQVSTFSDPAQRQQALLPEPNTNSTNNVSDPASRAQANQIAIVNADNTSPTPVSTFSDPAQRAQVADQVAIDQAAATNNVSDPASRAQANQVLIENADATAPVQVSTLQDPSQRAQVADQVAIDQATTINNVQDPAQRAQAREVVENATPTPIVNDRKMNDADYVNNADPAPVVNDRKMNDAEYIQNLNAPPVNDRKQNDAEYIQNLNPEPVNDRKQNDAEYIQNLNPAEVSGDPPIDRKMADADYTNNLIPTSGERGPQGLTAAKLDAQSQATKQDVTNAKSKEDWRVRLSLAPGAKQSKYLYWADPPGILSPLQATNGVIFPYTPSISVQYAASYDSTPLTHSNYKFSTYKSSSVDTITISCDFTAQDTFEAMYVLAVIHFFRSATKMFYGQDENPKLGTPPPLCYLTGLGQFQFDTHPLAITGFTYNLPVDVDYIRAGSTDTPAGVSRANNPAVAKPNGTPQSGASRLSSTGLNPGAVAPPPAWASTNFGTVEPTYVPTKINLSITAVPIITRSDISNVFSLKKYATGELLRGNKRSGGGIW